MTLEYWSASISMHCQVQHDKRICMHNTRQSANSLVLEKCLFFLCISVCIMNILYDWIWFFMHKHGLFFFSNGKGLVFIDASYTNVFANVYSLGRRVYPFSENSIAFTFHDQTFLMEFSCSDSFDIELFCGLTTASH